jgi:hypothetical protein
VSLFEEGNNILDVLDKVVAPDRVKTVVFEWPWRFIQIMNNINYSAMAHDINANCAAQFVRTATEIAHSNLRSLLAGGFQKPLVLGLHLGLSQVSSFPRRPSHG